MPSEPFDWITLLPFIVLGLGLAEIFFLPQISPLNLVFGLIVFVIAGIMLFKAFFQRKEAEPEEKPIEFRPETEKTEASESEEKEKISLDDFILSSPKTYREKEEERMQEKKLSVDQEKKQKEEPAEDYQKLKEKALKELKDVVKPKKKKGLEEKKELSEEIEEEDLLEGEEEEF